MEKRRNSRVADHRLKVKLTAGAAVAALVFAMMPSAQAQTKIDLTIGSSHPIVLPWIKLMKEYFQPEINKRLADRGNKYQINWTEAYGGTLYKANATLTSIGDGIADVGWVFSTLEGSRLPLAQVGNYTPGTTGNPEIVMEVVNQLTDTMPALRKEWDKANVVYLTSTAMDTLDLLTKFPVKSTADFKGKKIAAGGTIGVLVKGAGATPVNMAAPAFYNGLSTGLIEGAVTITTVMLGTKAYEKAQYLTKVDLGTFSAGALAFNKDKWKTLPKEVQDVVMEVSRDYSKVFGKNTNKMLPVWRSVIQKKNPNVVVTDLPDAERTKWLMTMDNVAKQWVESGEARGVPARAVLKAYMKALRERGVKPTRNWDEGL
jgi:TRAP-type C4-dicarboxylate transport system substrate-binding protein